MSEKETDTTNRLIRFLGGKTSYYVLGMVILLALIIYFSIRFHLYSSLLGLLSLLSCPHYCLR